MIDGEEYFIDANHKFAKLYRYSRGHRFVFHIGCWCRARGGGESDTGSLWYWLDNPTQIISIEYDHQGNSYAEDHHFVFKDYVTMVLKDVIFRRL